MSTSTGSPLTLATAPSKVPDKRFSAAARLDPYWGGVWHPGASARWLSRTGAERLADMGLGDLPAAFTARSREQAMEEILSHNRPSRLSALGAVGMWRTLTSEQLAALVGRASLATQRSVDADVLWASGLVDRGHFHSSLRNAAGVRLYRPERTGDFDALSTKLPYTDWVGVTGGVGWKWGNQFDRHNVLAAELGLRAAEYTDIACVLGESMSGIAHLSGALNCDLAVSSSRAADGLFVREDGMLVAIEISASVTSNLREKIEHWIEVLVADKSKRLTVLFVECAHPDFASSNGEVHRQLRKMVAKQAHGSMATALAEVPERMLLTRWTDWFPGAGRVTTEFLGLGAVRPTGQQGNRWEKVSLLDPFAFPFDGGDPSRESAVLNQCRSLFGVPHWMRTPSLDYSAIVRVNAGVTATPKLPYWRDYTPSGDSDETAVPA